MAPPRGSAAAGRPAPPRKPRLRRGGRMTAPGAVARLRMAPPAGAGEVRRGVADMLPVVVGYVPFAAVVGGAVAAHPDPVPAWLATPLVYGGAAQLAVLQAVQAGSGAAVAAAAGLLVNARLLVYSADMAPHWGGRRVPARMAAAALITDASWALGVRRHQAPGTADGRFRHYLAAAATLAGCWLVLVTAAALLGSRLPLGGDHVGGGSAGRRRQLRLAAVAAAVGPRPALAAGGGVRPAVCRVRRRGLPVGRRGARIGAHLVGGRGPDGRPGRGAVGGGPPPVAAGCGPGRPRRVLGHGHPHRPDGGMTCWDDSS